MTTRLLFLTLAIVLLVGTARAQSGAFDLPGGQLKATVTRGAETLPIGRVPELQAGDRIKVDVDLPADRSGKHMLVIAFLRDAASPPPKKWFRKLTLTRKAQTLTVTVPSGAEHALVLVAPEVGGGSGAVISAMRGRPGVFVRAARDLNQASLDRTRLEAFVEGIRAVDTAAPEQLEARSSILARSLAIRWTPECLQRQPSLQAACLTQNREGLILNDGRKATLTEVLTGAPADLAYRVSATPEGGRGFYNPYISLVRDVARLLGGFRSAQYQYIPALALRRGDAFRLLLNTAPSFNKPHSVLVAPLPPIGPAERPGVRAGSANSIACLHKRDLSLPIEGDPLVFATEFAHDLRLRVTTAGNDVVHIPVEADAGRGGLVLMGTAFPAQLGDFAEATLVGRWGFGSFEGPRFRVQGSNHGSWQVASGGSPVVGRVNEVILEGGTPACVEEVRFEHRTTAADPVEWKAAGDSSLTLALPLQDVRPGKIDLWIKRYGQDPEQLRLTAFEEASRVEAFTIHAGDRNGTLRGTRLDQVIALDFQGAAFRPGRLTRVKDVDELELSTDDPSLGSLSTGRQSHAKVRLRDGRSVTARAEVANPRPVVRLGAKTVEDSLQGASLKMQLLTDQAVPNNGVLTFSIRAQAGTSFAGGELVEIATPESPVAVLEIGGGLTRVDATTLVARFVPGEVLKSRAFGPLRFRVLQNDLRSDWEPLGTLARLPDVRSVTCDKSENTCTLFGSDLYLIESVSWDPSFSAASVVPPGYTASSLPLPPSDSGTVFLKLRDAPEVTVRVTSSS